MDVITQFGRYITGMGTANQIIPKNKEDIFFIIILLV